MPPHPDTTICPESKNLDSLEDIIGVQYKSDISGQSFDTYFILNSVYIFYSTQMFLICLQLFHVT